MKFFQDLWERVLATYVEVFVALLIVGWADVAHVGALSVLESAAIAAVPAGLAALKGFIARHAGNPDTASLVDGV